MKPGDHIGVYRLVALLGRGGMGEVFAAVHERMGQPVALKLLTRLDPSCAARFIQEARALSQLDHPGVVRVLFLGETGEGVPYLVMELVAGRSLRESLREHHAGLPRARALSLLAQVAAAMAAVHERGIVHRDLKPENILVVPRTGGSDGVKIIDFGIARVPSPEHAGPDTIVETGDEGPRWLGTAAYMAPEQCRRGTRIDSAADVYALGVVLYEALCGHTPFRSSDPVEMAALHLHAEPDLSAVDPGRVRRMVQRMLTKDPALRPSMSEVATELASLAGLAGIDDERRVFARGLLAAAGALVFVGAGRWAWSEVRQRQRFAKKDAVTATAHPEKGVSPVQMRYSGLILIDHMEWGAVSLAEMLASLPAAYRSLPRVRATAPVTGAAESGDFAAAGETMAVWFRDTVAPLISRHPDSCVVYFGVAPIPLILQLGWLVGPLHPVEVRLRHHKERRFLPWAEISGEAQIVEPRWSRERDERSGDVVVRLSTSHPINQAGAQAAVPDALCVVDLRLSSPGEDALSGAAEVEGVAAAWKELLDEITERFPRVQRVHLFASVQAGVAFLLGTRLSRSMHPTVITYQYHHPGRYQRALAINRSDLTSSKGNSEYGLSATVREVSSGDPAHR